MTKSSEGLRHMLRRTFQPAAVLIAGGFLLMSPLVPSVQAQSGPPAQTQGEQKPDGDKSEGDQTADEAKADEQAKAKAIAEYKDAAEKLPLSAGAPECVWTGRRIASLLWRDDIDTAARYISLYDRFGCSSEHLKAAFRCVVQQGPIDPKAADRLSSRVHGCWLAPKEATQTSSQATTGTTAEDGTIPN
ncbi:MAG: hypothetical protein ACOYB4_04355 [Methyloceanibacter sp.]